MNGLEQTTEISYLSSTEQSLERHQYLGTNPQVHTDVSVLNTSYQDLSCPEEVSISPGYLPSCLPQSAILPTVSATLAMESGLTSHVTPCSSPSSNLSPQPPDSDSYGRGGSPGHYRPTLHVEVCQKGDSTLRCTKLKELVLSMLRQRGTAFGELFLKDFEDPVMREHVHSVSITDVPHEVKVSRTSNSSVD